MNIVQGCRHVGDGHRHVGDGHRGHRGRSSSMKSIWPPSTAYTSNAPTSSQGDVFVLKPYGKPCHLWITRAQLSVDSDQRIQRVCDGIDAQSCRAQAYIVENMPKAVCDMPKAVCDMPKAAKAVCDNKVSPLPSQRSILVHRVQCAIRHIPHTNCESERTDADDAIFFGYWNVKLHVFFIQNVVYYRGQNMVQSPIMRQMYFVGHALTHSFREKVPRPPTITRPFPRALFTSLSCSILSNARMTFSNQTRPRTTCTPSSNCPTTTHASSKKKLHRATINANANASPFSSSLHQKQMPSWQARESPKSTHGSPHDYHDHYAAAQERVVQRQVDGHNRSVRTAPRRAPRRVRRPCDGARLLLEQAPQFSLSQHSREQ